LTVIGEAERTPNDNKIQWRCLCECGNYVTVRGTLLRKGGTKSCGCLRLEGFKRSPTQETRDRVSKTMKNRFKNKENHPLYGKKHTKNTKHKISETQKIRMVNPEDNPFYGKKHGIETRNKMSKNHANVSGKNHPNWKGGITERVNRCATMKYKKWRKMVFERDDYICQMCGQKGGILQAHHILQWAHNPSNRFEVDNGNTLCINCHKNLHTNRKLHNE